jgi:hypothetical protein
MLASSLPMRIAVSLAASLAVLAGVLHAQSDDDEDEMDYFPLTPSANQLRFSLRYIGGPKVSFGKLGNVPSIVNAGDTTSTVSRNYNDGYVDPDARKDLNGNPVNDGLTNSWNYQYTSQVTPGGDIAFHSYSASTLGAGLQAKGLGAPGWELQMGHSFGKIARKVDFSLVAGFSFSGLNAKIDSTVPAQLTSTTDVYALNGQAVPAVPYTGPTYGSQNVLDANGNPVLNSDGSIQTQSVETTTLLSSLPARTTTTSTTDVQGHWQIKGAYYTFRVGPLFQIPITERLKFSLGAGAAVAYVGINFIVQETLVDLVDVTSSVDTVEQKQHGIFLPAYYADADAEYWLTERTGFFLGANYQKSGSFDQTLNERTAKIDLSTTYGVQSGITLRF